MKAISKIFIVLSMLFTGLSSASAQSDYLLDYGPGSISWCWQMQQQVLNYYQQQAAAATQWMQTTPCTPMPGVMTYDGVYVTPETVSDYHKENVTCEHCDGGYNYRSLYMGNGKTRQVKRRCSWCHGKGYVTKTVRNE